MNVDLCCNQAQAAHLVRRGAENGMMMTIGMTPMIEPIDLVMSRDDAGAKWDLRPAIGNADLDQVGVAMYVGRAVRDGAAFLARRPVQVRPPIEARAGAAGRVELGAVALQVAILVHALARLARLDPRQFLNNCSDSSASSIRCCV